MAVVTIRARDVKRNVSERGRAGVRLGDREYSLDAGRIREIFFLGGEYYIRYETDHADFYRQYTVSEVPRLAIRLKFSVKEEKVFVCSVCGAIVEWDADEPFCPRFCDEKYDDWSYRETVKRYLVIEPDGDEIIQFAERLLGVRITGKAAELYRTAAGGFTPLFDVIEVEVPLFSVTVRGVAVVENPAFRESHYDEIEVREHRYEGRYVAVKYWGRGLTHYTALYRFEGEPDLTLLKQLHEEHRRKQEEERRKQEELAREIERKRKEEEQKWGDPGKVIEAIIKALPEWADGAVVIARVIRGEEDADVAYEVYPVKKSQRGGGYYYSQGWRTLSTGVPERFLEKLVDRVILKGGKVLEVKNKKQNGHSKYVTLET
jgi:hypothetical protein